MKTQGHKGRQGRQGRQARSGILLSLLSLLSLVSLSVPAFGQEPYLVKDINPVPEPASSYPKDFVTLGSAALFVASDKLSGEELWRSDGTAAGTWPVTDLCPSPLCTLNLQAFALTRRHFFFHAPDGSSRWQFWATDGTPAGTFQLTEPSVHAYGTGLPVGDVLYFNASVGGDEDSVEELWRSDGTPAGTWRVSEHSPQWWAPMVAFKGSVYFIGDELALWKTDGTPAGTTVVKSFPAEYSPVELHVVGSRLVFPVGTPDYQQELWSSDGTAEGTRVIEGIPRGPGWRPWFSDFSLQGGRLYFVFDDGRHGQELWVTDGTPEHTRGLTHLPRRQAFFSSGSEPDLYLPHAAAGNRFVFAVDDGPHGIEPWVTDGTVNGTHLLKDFCPGPCGSRAQVWDRTLPGLVFLTADKRNRGNELWVTDGTEAGTRLVRDICPGRCDGDPYAPFVVKGRLLFVADAGADGDELWSTGGTEANTIRISDFEPTFPWADPVSEDFPGTVAGGQLLFRAPGPEGYELWRADGTGPSGTRLVRDIATADILRGVEAHP